jgi:hypothetical protein
VPEWTVELVDGKEMGGSVTIEIKRERKNLKR